MNRKICLLLYLFSLFSNAQTISFDYPSFAGDTLSVSLKFGTKAKTVARVVPDSQGYATVSIPQEYAAYKGVAAIKNGDKTVMDFIINSENPIIKEDSKKVEGRSIEIKNSPENEMLQQWLLQNNRRREKRMLLSRLMYFYNQTGSFFRTLRQEALVLENEQHDFDKSLSDSPLYAASLTELQSFLSDKVQPLLYMDSAQMQIVRQYVANELNIKALYTSGLWYNILNGLLPLYDADSPFHTKFAADMSLLLSRTADLDIYTALSENLFEICEAMNWQTEEEQLSYFLINDGRIKEPRGKLKFLFSIYKLKKGNKAPVLSSGHFSGRRTLLMFYETDCPNCIRELEDLINNYNKFRDMGVDVISISADVDHNVYNKKAGSFPWKNKYCDFLGFSGPDFVNYGIVGTPTIFMIDNEGVIQGRYARIRDVKY